MQRVAPKKLCTTMGPVLVHAIHMSLLPFKFHLCLLRYRYGMASLVWDVPVFEFFKTYDHGISPTLTSIGQIRSLEDYERLVPDAYIRVEIERSPNNEEIRIVKDSNGEYHSTIDSDVAREILAVIDQQTSELFQFEIKAYPEGIPPGEEKHNDFHRHIIRYDDQRKRMLPGIRRAGYVSTIEEYKEKEQGNTWVMEEDFFVGITDTSTGDVWWATEELTKEVVERRKAMDDSCPLYSDEEEGDDVKKDQDE